MTKEDAFIRNCQLEICHVTRLPKETFGTKCGKALWLCIYMKKPFWSWKSGNSAISWPKSIHVSFHKKKEIYILHTSSKLFLWLKNFYKIPLRKKREVKEVWVDRSPKSNNTFGKVKEKKSIMIPWFLACRLYITDYGPPKIA